MNTMESSREEQRGAGRGCRTGRIAGAWLLLSAWTAVAGTADLAVLEKWSDVFGGKDAVFHVAVRAPEAFRGTVTWRFSAAGRSLARGERAVEAGPNRVGNVEVRLAVPPVKDGVVMESVLSVAAAGADGKPVAELTNTIWIFGEDAFADEREWLKGLPVHLLDPAGKTRECFEKAKIPFQEVRTSESLGEIRSGVVVVGEGVSFREHSGLWERLVRTAQGYPVLCLAPAEGEVVLPGAEGLDLPAPTAMAFRGPDVIRELDKRLDADAWPVDGRIQAGGLVIRAGRGASVLGEVRTDGKGWAWLDLRFGGIQKRLVVCGFPVVGKWDEGPAPRYLLSRMLKTLTGIPIQ